MRSVFIGIFPELLIDNFRSAKVIRDFTAMGNYFIHLDVVYVPHFSSYVRTLFLSNRFFSGRARCVFTCFQTHRALPEKMKERGPARRADDLGSGGVAA